MIQQDLADRIIDSTFVTYPGLAPWQAGVVEFAKSRGYIETAYGNRRHATPDLWSGDRSLSSRQERQLINSAIQGTAADILKVVRQEIYRRKIHERYRTRANKQVYDEITASVPIEAAVDYACEMAEIMEIVPPGYPVGMTVDIAIGHTWGSVHEAGSTDRSALAELVDKLKTGEISE